MHKHMELSAVHTPGTIWKCQRFHPACLQSLRNRSSMKSIEDIIRNPLKASNMSEDKRESFDTLMGAFAAPFTKEEMLAELYDALWSWVRGLSLNLDDQTVMNLLAGANPPIDPRDLAEYDEGAASRPGFIGLAKKWEIVRALNDLYDFGMLGIVRSNMDEFDSESMYMRASAFLLDLNDSKMQEAIDGFGRAFLPRKALITAQTGAARCTLEGHEGFYAFPGQGQDRLTIRDIALLAKMEEKSIRNAANRNRPGFLKTTNEAGSTWIHPEDAKEWLTARGRYLPITRHFHQTEWDLASKGFHDMYEANLYLEECIGAVPLTTSEFIKVAGLDASCVNTPDETDRPDVPGEARLRLALDREVARNTKRMRKVATTLGLAPELFCLRMAEVAAREELEELQAQIKTHARPG